MPIKTKYCPKCRKTKGVQHFSKDLTGHDGLSGYCTECKKEYDAGRKTKNKIFFGERMPFDWIWIIIPLLLFSFSSLSQFKIQSDTLIYSDSIRFVRGEFVSLNTGTCADKSFAYIYTSEKSFYGMQKLASDAAFIKMKIKDFKIDNDKPFLILSTGSNIKFWCDIKSSLQAGEIKMGSKPWQ